MEPYKSWRTDQLLPINHSSLINSFLINGQSIHLAFIPLIQNKCHLSRSLLIYCTFLLISGFSLIKMVNLSHLSGFFMSTTKSEVANHNA